MSSPSARALLRLMPSRDRGRSSMYAHELLLLLCCNAAPAAALGCLGSRLRRLHVAPPMAPLLHLPAAFGCCCHGLQHCRLCSLFPTTAAACCYLRTTAPVPRPLRVHPGLVPSLLPPRPAGAPPSSSPCTSSDRARPWPSRACVRPKHGPRPLHVRAGHLSLQIRG